MRLRRSWAFGIAWLLWVGGSAGAQGVPNVVSYDAVLVVDTVTRLLTGAATITLSGAAGSVDLAAAVARVDAVSVDGRAVDYLHEGDVLRVRLPARGGAADTVEIRVHYVTGGGSGLRFTPSAIYTYFHTARWLPHHAALTDRERLRLTVMAPRGWLVLAPGVQRASPSIEGVSEYVLDEAHPAYLFGFAVARGQVRLTDGAQPGFTAIGPDSAALAAVLHASRSMLAFLEERAGVSVDVDGYAQVFLEGAPAQEHAGYSLMSARYLAAFAADPAEDYLIVHELAHQWWGNRATAASWVDFWLHEGIVTFMTAAWKEQRWGRAAYERELELARARYASAIAANGPRALVDSAHATAATAGGAVPYSLGFLTLDALRREIGADAFWEGLRAFTRDGVARRVVTTPGLQAALERSSGRDLTAFFEHWVYSTAPPL